MADPRPRPWEADESSRSRESKTPRLDLLAATATAAAEADDLLGWEECPELTDDDDDDDRCCNHVPTDSAHKEILSWSLLSDDAGTCKDCRREEGTGGVPKYRRILVCLECGRHSCGNSRSYLPYGHARDHAKQEQHWVAALFDDPETGFCFKCDCERPVYPEPDDELELEITGEIQAGGGGHAFGFDMPRDLAAGLLHLGDAWRAAQLGSANAHGYAIRGMPNRGNTCYMNAIVQCLLALEKLRAWMLAPDPPPLGHLGMALKELFVEASAADSAGGLMNPDELLRSVRLHAGKYEAYKMHDSYELLESLRNALQDEENGIETPYRERGAPTVVDSIFRGELLETRSCVYCQSASVFHGHFWELSLSLPSKEDLCKSFASSPLAGKSLKPQPKKAATELLSASESNSLGMIDAKSTDSHLVSELNDLVADKTSDPMEVDSAEEQRTYQNKDVIQDPLYTKESLHSVGFAPHSISDAKAEQMIQMTIDSSCLEDHMGPSPLVAPLSEHDAWTASGSYVDQNGKAIGDINCIPTIEDCLSLFFKEEVVEWSCDCSKVPMEPNTNQNRKGKQMDVGTNVGVAVNKGSIECKFSHYRQQDGSDAESEIIQMVDSNIVGANSSMSCGHEEIEYHDIQEVACSLLPTHKQTNLLSSKHSQYLIPPNHELRKRVWLDLSANQLEGNQNEYKERSGCAIQRPRIKKLPLVLTLHLKRYIKSGNEYHKNEASVSYKEHIDVGQFMDSSSMDNNNSIYRLAGVVEHRGGPFMNTGHYVAYVRARKIRNQQKQSSSSSWFCADDSNIREVTLEEVLKCKPYVLFYERMKAKTCLT